MAPHYRAQRNQSYESRAERSSGVECGGSRTLSAPQELQNSLWVCKAIFQVLFTFLIIKKVSISFVGKNAERDVNEFFGGRIIDARAYLKKFDPTPGGSSQPAAFSSPEATYFIILCTHSFVREADVVPRYAILGSLVSRYWNQVIRNLCGGVYSISVEQPSLYGSKDSLFL